MKQEVNIFWFRRDLRLEDNIGFQKALQGKLPVLPIFIFDINILSELPKDDARLNFIHNCLTLINSQLKEFNSGLGMYHGKPIEVFKRLSTYFDLKNVITNRDYEEYGIQRDVKIQSLLAEKEIGFYSFKDHVIFEKNQIVKSDGTAYKVYTPYMKKWKEQFAKQDVTQMETEVPFFENLYKGEDIPSLTLVEIDFVPSKIDVPQYQTTPEIIQEYENVRNYPSKNGTSYLGPHLRFGTVSIRQMVKKASFEKNDTFLNELIWREFFMQLLWHFPHTVTKAFKPKYDRIQWRNNESEFEAWKNGKTGYPMVDAGMRQLNQTGLVHNRVRMVVASFLCKHLLIDWRWGEAYFAEKLLDYEQASNVGNWQWVAGSGADAAPYFRIFNPQSQLKHYDEDGIYVSRWVEELNSIHYSKPIVDHKEARTRCIQVYKRALQTKL